VATDPHHAFHVRSALADPAARAERIRAVAPRPGSAWATLASFILGVLLGPTLAYAALGNPWRSYPDSIPRWAAGGAALLLALLLLAITSRYAQPGRLGALAGLGGGLAQVVLVSVPWLSIASAQPSCTAQGACTVAPSVAVGYAAVAALFYALPLILFLAALASVAAYWAQRRRFEAAIRRA
jgi:hypothetical protein